MKYRYVQNAFSSGELHPRLDGRTDLEEYAKGVDTLENFITFRQGGVSRRMGSRYVGTLSPAAPSSYVGLYPFIFSKKESYAISIEILSTTSIKVQIYDPEGNLASITTSKDNPTDLATSKNITISGRGLSNLTTDVNSFTYAQSADVFFLTHSTGNMKPLVVARIEADTFYIKDIEDYQWTTNPDKTLYTPFKDANIDSGKHLFVSGGSSSVTLTMKDDSSGTNLVPFFAADATANHKDAYFISHSSSLDDHVFKVNAASIPAAFTGNFGTPSANQLTSTSHGMLTGDAVRLSGTIPTGLSATLDYYIIKVSANVVSLASTLANARAGTVLTVGTTSSVTINPKFISTVVATDYSKITTGHSHNFNTDNWNESSFNNYQGFPRTISIFEQRLIYGGTILSPDTLYGSITGNFFHFTETRYRDGNSHSIGKNSEFVGDSVATDPFQFTIASQEVNEITWLAPRNHLEVGTLGTEYIVTGGENALSAVTPPFIKAQTSNGSSSIQAKKVDQSTIFVSRDGRLLREFKYNNDNGSYISRSLSISAEHIVSHLFDGDSTDASAGIEIVQFVYQASRGIVWCLTSRNALIGLTIDNDTQTVAWHKHVFGGTAVKINSLTVIPNSTGTHDDLYLSLSRTIDGSTVHRLEKLGEDFSHTKLKNDSTSDDDQAYFSDSSKRVQMSTLTKTFTTIASNGTTITGHGLGTGTKLQLTTGGSLPTGLALSTDYYLIKKDANTVQFATTAKNAFDHIPITISGGSGTHTITPSEAYIIPGFLHLKEEDVEVLADGFYEQNGYIPPTLTVLYNKVNASNDRINLVYSGGASTVIAHYLVTGTEIYYKSFANAAIGGITEDTTYYVIRHDDDYFQLATTYANALAGTAIDLTTTGITSGHFEFYPSNAPTRIDEGGFLRLNEPVSEVIVGLKYTSKLKTMKLEAGAQFGTSQGSIKRNDSIVLRFQGTYGGKFGIATNEANLEEIVFRPPGHGMGDPLPLFTGDKFLDFPGDYERFFQVVVQQDKPMPMNLLSIVHRGITYD
tara:strand:+ start:3247 stop:6333 length:3087 start_codon:yes stop_codon:yes gene_type:complete